MEPYAAVILAGGAGRRLGGVGKPMLAVGGRPMLDRVLGAVPDATDRIVVGPPSLRLPTGVRRVQERPAGGGPVAATAAGLAAIDAPTVALLAADLPFLGRVAIRTLRDRLAAATAPAAAAIPAEGTGPAAGTGPVEGAGPAEGTGPGEGAGPADGVVFVDGDGRRQTLCGVWRTAALRDALARIGAPAGVPLRVLLAWLRVAEVPAAGVPGIAGGPPPWYDCDDPDDLHRAQEWL